ncbi:MAG: hypothetical protein FJX54_21435 [Alphaproteobacteria bacterium]|nr:hypothetical protein [Alphaproteobacteria bacterium]
MPEATAKLIQLPNRLRDRVSGQADGLSFEEILARSAAIVVALTGEWRIGALYDLSELTRLAGEMHADPLQMGPLLPAFFSLAHGIQGQAGTFGYGEVSHVAASLCDYLADLDAAGGNIGEPRRHLAIFDHHLAQLRRLLIDDVRDMTVDLRQTG